MVKPIPARRLSRQSMESPHDDVSVDEEAAISSEPSEPDDEIASNRGLSIDTSRLEELATTGTENLPNRFLPAVNESTVGHAGNTAVLSIPSTSNSGNTQHRLRNRRKHTSSNVPSEAPHSSQACSGDSSEASQQMSSDNHPNVQDPNHSRHIPPQRVAPHTSALSQELYMQFLQEEIQVTGFQGSTLTQLQGTSFDRQYNNSWNTHCQVRRSLRQVADAFASSNQRELVRQQAASVNIESLDFDSFQNLLYGLFQEGGVTSERVVVLFYFCSDLIVRSLQEQLTNSFHYLLDWSQLYIIGSFSEWIEEHGGWVAVLDQSFNRLYTAAKIGIVCAGIVALCVYIRNSR